MTSWPGRSQSFERAKTSPQALPSGRHSPQLASVIVVEVLKNRSEGAQHGRILFRQRWIDRETGSELEARWNGHLRQDAQVPVQGWHPRCTFSGRIDHIVIGRIVECGT